MFFIGGTVNPLARGLQNVYDLELGHEIAEIVSKEPDSKWIVETTEPQDLFLASFPIVYGAPTITSVNIYPELQRWEKLDAKEQYREVYNRYAHIRLQLTDMETTFSVGEDRDILDVKLNVDDLARIEGKYILSRRNLDGEYPNAGFERVFSFGAYTIYRK